MKKEPMYPFNKDDAGAALKAADLKMEQAKHRFSLAALACIRGALDAPALVQAALAEVDAARAALREATAE